LISLLIFQVALCSGLSYRGNKTPSAVTILVITRAICHQLGTQTILRLSSLYSQEGEFQNPI